MQAIKAGIEAAEKAPVPGVTEFIDVKQNFQVIVDSANSPERLIRLLDDVRECEPKKILLVVGCEGELTDKDYRREMGKVAHWKVNMPYADL